MNRVFTPAGPRHRLDANGVRHLWRQLVAGARALSVAAEGGEQWSEPLGFRNQLKGAPTLPAPRGDLMAALVDRAFRAAADGFLAAGTGERRLIAAPLLAAAAQAAEAMLEAEIAPYAALSRRISGDTEMED